MIEEGFEEQQMVEALSNENVVDIVTAYVPQRPWWVSPTQRGRKK